MALHPQAQAFVDSLAEQQVPSWAELGPSEGRKVFSSLTDLFATGPELASVEDFSIPDGVAVRVFSPGGDGPQPALIYFHGGGWVLGDLDTHDGLCRAIADQSACVVVAVDYRRAPEHRFPAALIDCYQAVQYVSERADQFGIDRTRLAVGGDSAGGSLALGVARRARDDRGPAICHQLLIYPVVEPAFETPSYLEFAEGYGLTRESMQWFWDQYLGCPPQEADEYVAPSRASDLGGLPDAHIVTAEYDVLRDEGESLAQQLAAAGVPTTSRRYPGMLHGFIHLAQVFDVGRQAIADVAETLKTAFKS